MKVFRTVKNFQDGVVKMRVTYRDGRAELWLPDILEPVIISEESPVEISMGAASPPLNVVIDVDFT